MGSKPRQKPGAWHFHLAWHFSSGYLGYGDNRKVEAGVTYECDGKPALCENGMHGSVLALDAMSYRKGGFVSRVMISGDVIEGAGKIVGRRRRVLWCADAADTLREFARLCALDVIDKWDAPEIVVRYLKAGDESIRLDARRAAARAAAAYAAAAARAAADAAYAAAADAADAAAADAAADGAYAAAGAAAGAGAAARDKQNERLTEMLCKLGGES